MNHELRYGNITSSDIYLLLSSRKGVKENYIDECNMERRLARSLNSETSARPTSWGQLLERRVSDLLGLNYKIMLDETLIHPQIPFWVGSPDAVKFDEGKTVVDIKSPYTLKSFCQLVDCNSIEEVRDSHKDGEKFYWQLVSNSVLTDSRYAELIIYMPYQSELHALKELTEDMDEPNKFAWIHFSPDSDLPFLKDGGNYKNLNLIRFEVKQEDKDLLTATVQAAGLRLEQINIAA